MDELHQTEDIVRDRYRILSLLGEGSTGSTYKAIDLTHSQAVAIKVVSFRQVRDWKVLELFEREAKILASLEHPAIPKYLDYFHEDTPTDRRFYLIRELIEGNSLTIEIAAGWHPQEAEVKIIAKQILNILIYLHGLNPPVIHRDIKPENIIRDSEGKIFLVDFGGVQEVYRKTLSHSGTFVGTVGYMPPEQFRGQAIFASDLYALGTTLLYLLTRCSPEDLPQKRMKIDFHSYVSISKKFARWLEKAIEPAIEDRFHSARNALEILKARQTIILRYEKPEYSRIILEKKSGELFINIPANPWGRVTIIILCASLCGIIIIGLLLLNMILHYIETSIFYQFSLLLVINSVYYIIFFSIKRIEKTKGNTIFISIDKTIMQFQKEGLFSEYVIRSKPINLKQTRSDPDSKTLRLLFRKGQEIKRSKGESNGTIEEFYSFKKVEFGSWLKQAERDWLQAEIAEFIENL